MMCYDVMGLFYVMDGIIFNSNVWCDAMWCSLSISEQEMSKKLDYILLFLVSGS